MEESDPELKEVPVFSSSSEFMLVLPQEDDDGSIPSLFPMFALLCG